MDIPKEEKAQQDKRQAIQAIRNDTSLTASQKQARIQQFMSSGGHVQAASVAAASSDDCVFLPTDASVAATDPSAFSTDAVASVATRHSAADSVGALASPARDDNVQRKLAGARGTSQVSSVSKLGLTQSSHQEESFNTTELPSAPPVGSVSSAGADPAARKGGRSSRTSSRSSMASNATTGVAAGSLGSPTRSTAGATLSSFAQDPALRKGARSSARSSQNNDRTSSSSNSVARATGGAVNAAAVATMTAATTAETPLPSAPTTVVSEQVSVQAPELNEASPPSASDVDATPETTASSSSPPGVSTQDLAPETYAGLNYSSEDIAGGDDGGIQAYVSHEEAIDVCVVTESEIEAKENKKNCKYLMGGGLLFVLLLVAVIVTVVIVQGIKKDAGPPVVVNTTESPSAVPSASPSSSTYFELLTTLESLYSDNELFTEAFSDPSSPQYRAAIWAADIAPLGFRGNSPRMISRYSLAVLYFATNGDDWVRCGRDSKQCDPSEEWLTAENECDWYAISCLDPENGDYTVQQIFFRKLLRLFEEKCLLRHCNC